MCVCVLMDLLELMGKEGEPVKSIQNHINNIAQYANLTMLCCSSLTYFQIAIIFKIKYNNS